MARATAARLDWYRLVSSMSRQMELGWRVCRAREDCSYTLYQSFGFGCPGCGGSYADAIRRIDDGPTPENVYAVVRHWFQPLYLRSILGITMRQAEALRAFVGEHPGLF